MARPLRIEYSGAFYHVMNRGLERREIFHDSKDYERFLTLLDQVNQRYRIRVHSYCLMSNHYHLYVETPQGNLSKVMRQLDGVYTQGYNRRYRRIGPLMQGRYKAILVEKESYSLEISRYIHLNPVKAGLVERPEEWEWSSYRVYLGKKRKELYVETQWLLGQFFKRENQARVLFKKFTLEGMQKAWEPAKELKGGCLLGGESFCDWVKEEFLEKRRDPEITGIRELEKRVSVEELMKKVNSLTGDGDIGKKLTMYLLRQMSSLSLKEIGEKMGGMGYKAVWQVVSRLEASAGRDRELMGLIKKAESVCR